MTLLYSLQDSFRFQWVTGAQGCKDLLLNSWDGELPVASIVAAVMLKAASFRSIGLAYRTQAQDDSTPKNVVRLMGLPPWFRTSLDSLKYVIVRIEDVIILISHLHWAKFKPQLETHKTASTGYLTLFTNPSVKGFKTIVPAITAPLMMFPVLLRKDCQVIHVTPILLHVVEPLELRVHDGGQEFKGIFRSQSAADVWW